MGKEDHFPTKLYRMLGDVERFRDKSVISWSHDGLFFVVHQPKVFAESWMKKYFKQSKYKSFQRQLNFYNFQRATQGKILGVYSHPLFRRGRMETLKKMHRIKKQPSVAVSLDLKTRNKRGEWKKNINKAHTSTTTITTRTATSTPTPTIRNGYFMNHSSLQTTTTTTKPDVPIFIPTNLRNQAQQQTISCDYFSKNIIIEGNDDDDDDNDHNEGVTTGRSMSSIVINTEEEVPDSIPSKSSMIGMKEEVEEEVLTSFINNTLVWGGGTITGGVTTCEDQQQVKKEGKKKEDEEATTVEKEDDNDNDKGYESRVEGISPNTDDAFPTAASTNRCVRRKFNSNNNKDYDDNDVKIDGIDDDDERKPPPKKKTRVLAVVEASINCEAN